MSPRPSEDELIARYFAPLAGLAGLGLRDDAALLEPPAAHDLVLTADALVGGVHFFEDDPPGLIARKALRVNLSDLAAKGAQPLGFLLSLALPRGWREDWLAAFAGGLRADAEAYGCPLAGGDTVATPGPLTLSITAFGAVPAGRMARRTGVRPGDRLYVTGTIGDAAIGLKIRQGRGPDIPKSDKAFLADRYLTPQPRTALAKRDGALGERRHGRLRRFRRRPDQDAARCRASPRACRSSSCRCRPPPARRSRPTPISSRLRRPGATTMKSWRPSPPGRRIRSRRKRGRRASR